MRKIITLATAAVTAGSLILAPVAAQANTRAGDNGARYVASANSQSGLQRAPSGEREAGWFAGVDLTTVLLGATGFMLVVAVLTSTGSSNNNGGFQSNGAN